MSSSCVLWELPELCKTAHSEQRAVGGGAGWGGGGGLVSLVESRPENPKS